MRGVLYLRVGQASAAHAHQKVSDIRFARARHTIRPQITPTCHVVMQTWGLVIPITMLEKQSQYSQLEWDKNNDNSMGLVA